MLIEGEREHSFLLLIVPREIEDYAGETRYSCGCLGMERAEQYGLERRHI